MQTAVPQYYSAPASVPTSYQPQAYTSLPPTAVAAPASFPYYSTTTPGTYSTAAAPSTPIPWGLTQPFVSTGYQPAPMLYSSLPGSVARATGVTQPAQPTYTMYAPAAPAGPLLPFTSYPTTMAPIPSLAASGSFQQMSFTPQYGSAPAYATTVLKPMEEEDFRNFPFNSKLDNMTTWGKTKKAAAKPPPKKDTAKKEVAVEE